MEMLTKLKLKNNIQVIAMFKHLNVYRFRSLFDHFEKRVSLSEREEERESKISNIELLKW